EDKFYLMERIIDEVSIDEINRYINIEKSKVRTFETMEEEKLQTGLLLGIKIPTYDEINDISHWEYKTICINSKDRNITRIYELENLLLHSKNGIWMIKIERKIYQRAIKEKINVVPKFHQDNSTKED